jgi:hypothetical protein
MFRFCLKVFAASTALAATGYGFYRTTFQGITLKDYEHWTITLLLCLGAVLVSAILIVKERWDDRGQAESIALMFRLGVVFCFIPLIHSFACCLLVDREEWWMGPLMALQASLTTWLVLLRLHFCLASKAWVQWLVRLDR